MIINSKNAFYVSVILHALFFLVLIVWTFLSSLRAKETPFVFNMVAPPVNSSSQESIDRSQSEEFPPDPNSSESETFQPEIEEIPPSKLSYKEFVEQHGVPERQKSVTPTPKKVRIEDIDTENLREELENALASDRRHEVNLMSLAEQGEIQRYISALKMQINHAWNKPLQLSGRQFLTTVRFVVSQDGELSGVEITDSSKNELFDSSVVAAFDRVGRADPPPDNSYYTLILTFRMIE